MLEYDETQVSVYQASEEKPPGRGELGSTKVNAQFSSLFLEIWELQNSDSEHGFQHPWDTQIFLEACGSYHAYCV